jgi:hypothetical protein
MSGLTKLKQRRDFLLERIHYEWHQRCLCADSWATLPPRSAPHLRTHQIIIQLIRQRVLCNLKELAAILKKPWPYTKITAIGVIFQKGEC